MAITAVASKIKEFPLTNNTICAIISGIGFFIIAGTAGVSDLNPYMSLTQITIQSLVGLGLLGYGVLKLEHN